MTTVMPAGIPHLSKVIDGCLQAQSDQYGIDSGELGGGDMSQGVCSVQSIVIAEEVHTKV